MENPKGQSEQINTFKCYRSQVTSFVFKNKITYIKIKISWLVLIFCACYFTKSKAKMCHHEFCNV